MTVVLAPSDLASRAEPAGRASQRNANVIIFFARLTYEQATPRWVKINGGTLIVDLRGVR